MTQKHIYTFGGAQTEGSGADKALLGGKGANLAEMSRLGLPVPPGFTITTEVCIHFTQQGGVYPDGLEAELDAGLRHLETEMGLRFGDTEKPLLLSVRSGAAVSMPGMMDTVLNLGLNDATVAGLARATNSERFAWDSYRRFVQMYGDVVLGVRAEADAEDPFETLLAAKKRQRGVDTDVELDAEALRELVAELKTLISERTGRSFPTDPKEQLWGAVGAVFGSWNNPRAMTYRRLNDIPEDLGTAVNVQVMVFGNLGDDCATGVAFTRSPATGEAELYGEWLPNAQGEDVVAGTRTPGPLRTHQQRVNGPSSLEQAMPELYTQLAAVATTLEHHYRDMQDLEFTIQQGRLFMLQTRNGKRTAAAALKMAVDMVDESLIDRATALRRVAPKQLEQLLHPRLDPDAPKTLLVKGLPASPGAAVGHVVFTAEDAQNAAARGEPCVLVRIETSPEDISGMHAAEGILTQRGGMTSHAAVVARGMGKCCVSGAGDISIDYSQRLFTTKDGQVVREGEWISLDGGSGDVYAGAVARLDPELSGDFARFMEWADAARSLKIRTNADTPRDAKAARQFGAEGIGLCRTEHMFFHDERIGHMRRMILAATEAERKAALDSLLPFQKQDFKEIFAAMAGHPVTIRLLDPPLHEFLPRTEAEMEAVCQTQHYDMATLRQRLAELREVNPMLGFRGCRISVLYPEITDMQIRAVLTAALELRRDNQMEVLPEIMVPLVGARRELTLVKDRIMRLASSIQREQGEAIDFLVGTMIELPRAALTAGDIAHDADFFSFGTNDLTQMTLGLSRDDAGAFLPRYIEEGIYAANPFVVLDQNGVGRLLALASQEGRATRPELKLGICGEHGGEPAAVARCHQLGFNYVSCSPYRVPIARLAAAQAALED